MELSRRQEKILKTIESLGPDHIYNKMFQDPDSQAALAGLIRAGLVRPDFSAKDEAVDQYLSGRPASRDDFDLHLGLTEKGLARADEIYLPNRLFSGRLAMVTAIVCVALMTGLSLWLLY